METEPSLPRTQFTSVADAAHQQPQQRLPSTKPGNTSSPELEVIEGMSLIPPNADTAMGNTGPLAGVGIGGGTLGGGVGTVGVGGVGGGGGGGGGGGILGVQQPKVQTAFIHKLYKYGTLLAILPRPTLRYSH